MKAHKYSYAATVLLLAVSFLSISPARMAARQQPKLTPGEILSAAAENGKQLLVAMRDYTYNSELTIQSVSLADIVTGELRRFSQVSFDPEGNRQERILEDNSTLPKDLSVGTATINNLLRVYQFQITPETLSRYEFSYVGREKVDELSTYVFDVKPKVKMPDPEKSADRYLKGRVWIDDQDLCVVKVSGEALPEQRDGRAPRFETYFQNYGRYWFPAFVSADDRIRDGRYSTRIVVKARFTSYKKATARG